MKRGSLELVVGVFVLAGLACLAYLAIHLGKTEIWGGGYRVVANFDNISGLKPGAAVEVAGVDVGRVESIHLTKADQAKLVLRINRGVKIYNDAIASIRTKGIIGDKFVKLSPGGAGKLLPNGGTIRDTESAVEWEELISQYIHGKV
jgi:phospholipid/cholesterol/gamma-HCH transport system substrate-binding protein